MFAPADYVLRPLTGDDESFLWEMLYQALSPPALKLRPAKSMQRPEYARFVEGWGRPNDKGYVAQDRKRTHLLGAVWLRSPAEVRSGRRAP